MFKFLQTLLTCKHERSRCLHGDEILHLMKVRIVRFWKEDVFYRQVCLDCGKRLERRPICAVFPERHTYKGVWRE